MTLLLPGEKSKCQMSQDNPSTHGEIHGGPILDFSCEEHEPIVEIQPPKKARVESNSRLSLTGTKGDPFDPLSCKVFCFAANFSTTPSKNGTNVLRYGRVFLMLCMYGQVTNTPLSLDTTKHM